MNQNQQNAHMRNIQMYNLIDENESLRNRIAKLSEIEQYIEVLLEQKNTMQRDTELLMRDKQEILISNEALRQQLDANLRVHSEQITTVFEQHDWEISQLHQTISTLTNQLQAQHNQTQAYQEQVNKLKAKQHELIADCEAVVMQSQQENQQVQQELRNAHNTLQHQKHTYNVSHEQYLCQLQKLKMHLRENNLHVTECQKRIDILTKQNVALLAYNDNIANAAALREKQLSNLLQKQQQSNETITHQCRLLKDNNILFQKQINNQKQQIDVLIIQCNNFESNIQQLTKNLSTNNKVRQQIQHQNKSLRTKITQNQTNMQQQINKYTLQMINYKEQIANLHEKCRDSQNTIQYKLNQIKELINIVDQLESALNIQEQNKREYEIQLHKCEQKNRSLQNSLQQSELASKALREKCVVLDQTNSQLQSVLDTQKHKLLTLQSCNHQLQRVINNPREMNKQSSQKIDRLVKQFYQQRSEINEKHKQQKQKLKDIYEYKYKQKQAQLLRQMGLLQQEFIRYKKNNTFK